MATKKANPETKTFILGLKGGHIRKITIPATWKLTFGSVVPFGPGPRHGGEGGVALRLYEGNKENLRAVMTDVVSVRDASIQMMEKRTSTQRKAAQKQTPHGMKDVVVEARVTEWVNPDAEEDEGQPNEFLKLTGPETSEIEF
jgi:hypothetical protein